jgi:hypothetical protein
MISNRVRCQIMSCIVLLALCCGAVWGADDWFRGQWKGTWSQDNGGAGTFRMTIQGAEDGTLGGSLTAEENGAEIFSAPLKDVSVTGSKVSMKYEIPGAMEVLIEGEQRDGSIEGVFSFRPVNETSFTPQGSWKASKQ